jgi:hypothetical protein
MADVNPIEAACSHDQPISRSHVWKATEGTMTAYRRLIVSVTVIGFLVGVATTSAQLMDKKGLTLEAAKKIEGVNLGSDTAILQLSY